MRPAPAFRTWSHEAIEVINAEYHRQTASQWIQVQQIRARRAPDGGKGQRRGEATDAPAPRGTRSTSTTTPEVISAPACSTWSVSQPARPAASRPPPR